MIKPASLVTTIFLGLVALAQLMRVIFGVQVIVRGDIEVPVWASGVAFVFVGSLAIWLWFERKN